MKSARSSRSTVPPAILAVMLVALVLTVYWPAMRFGFVDWDDLIHLVNNPLMHPPSFAHIAHFWRHSYFGLYVPVTYTAWSLLAMIGRIPGPGGAEQFNPYLFHSLNIATHILACLVVWQLLQRLVRQKWAAWFGAAIFALHPTSVEAVAWVSGFRDVLSGLLALAALWLYMPGRDPATEAARPRWRYILSTFLFILAVLAKPSAVAVIPMAVALDWIWFHRRVGSTLLRLLPWTAVAIVVVVINHSIQGAPVVDTPPWWERPLIAGDALTFYLGKLFVPIHLCLQYDRSPHRVLADGMAIRNTAIATMVGILIYLLGRRWRWVWLSGALFLAGLIPVLGLVPFDFQYFSTVADRYLYLALLGFSIAVAFVLASRPTRIFYSAAVLVLLALAILSFRQVLTWRSTETLFTRILQINPRSNLALTKLSHEKLEAGDLRAANEFAQRALAVHPDVSLDWINVGKAMEDLHHPDLARKCYLHVLQTDSSRDSAGAYSNLAAMRADAGDYAGAIKLYQQALAHDPDLPAARIGLASARRQLAKTQ